MNERTKFYMEHGWDNELVAKLVGILEDEFETTIDIIEVLEDIDLAMTKAEATNARLRAAVMRFVIETLPTAQLIQEFHPDTEDHSDTYKMAQHIIDGIGDVNEALERTP